MLENKRFTTTPFTKHSFYVNTLDISYLHIIHAMLIYYCRDYVKKFTQIAQIVNIFLV